jgi:hypothetical protein
MIRADATRLMPALVPVVVGLRAVLQTYEQLLQAGWFRIGTFLWFMLPYLLCFAVWAKGPPYASAVAALLVAVLAEAFAFYTGYTGRDGQSGILIVLMPLWSTVLLCPIAIFLARSSERK